MSVDIIGPIQNYSSLLKFQYFNNYNFTVFIGIYQYAIYNYELQIKLGNVNATRKIDGVNASSTYINGTRARVRCASTTAMTSVSLYSDADTSCLTKSSNMKFSAFSETHKLL